MKTFIAVLLSIGLVSAFPKNTEIKEKAKSYCKRGNNVVEMENTMFTISGWACNDAADNCASYGPSVCTTYQQWASDNCQATCNLCSSGSGSEPQVPQIPQIPQTGGGSSACSDQLSNCNSYDPSVCSSSTYKQWATDNCAKTCNLCSGGGSGTGTGTGTGTGGGGTITGSSSGCYYNSQVYRQGQTWNDGCKYKCRCVDGTSGQYECRQLCLNWDLPPTCHMNPPASGKCCPKPSCPSNIVLQYPQGYVEE